MASHRASVFVLLLLLVFPVACTKAETPQSEYGSDADYYMALRALDSRDTETATRLFSQAAKKGSPFVARRASEELGKLGSVGERIETLEKLYKTYSDETSLLALCRELTADNEYASIIKHTAGIDLASCDNEIAYYRFLAMLKKSDSKFSDSFLEWCTSRPFSSFHYKIYSQIESPLPLVQFRASVYDKKYEEALAFAKQLLSEPHSVTPQLASDIGKCLLYGSTRYAENAALCDNAATQVNKNCVFYMHFYAGRLYEKAGSSFTRIKDRYKKAMDESASDSLFDNACWYYLSAALNSSPQEAVDEVSEFRSKWHDPYYYDDFFDTLSLRLISEHLWKEYYRTATLIDGYASDETVAKYSYMSARFIQSGYLKFNEPSEPIVQVLLTRCLSSGSDFYYRILAAHELKLPEDEIEKLLLAYGIKTEYKIDPDCEKLMNGYADFGLSNYIYSEWQRFDSLIGSACVERLSGFLKDCADNANGSLNSYYEQSIRMASRRVNYPEGTLTKTLLSLAYPKDFSQHVEEAAAKFETPDYLMYALIRSESFFAPKVTSYASAVGLTQLMESTAADVARKLRINDYNLEDPKTNIMFGTFYLAELQSRLNGAYINSFFSYNGGITRVRSWIKSAALEFGTDSLANDIFLEALPYAETREYGRKITAAASLYAWLYDGISINNVVEQIMQI